MQVYTATRRRRWVSPALALLVVIGLLTVSAAAAWAAWPRDEVMPPGVRVAGHDVGGRPVAEVRDLLTAEAQKRVGRTIVLSIEDRSVKIDPRWLRPRPEIAAVLEQAQESRGPMGRLAARLGFADPVDVPLTFALHRPLVDTTVRQAAKAVDLAPTPARVEVQAGEARAVPGRPGRRLDAAKLRGALRTLPARVQADVKPVPAVPTTEAAERARTVVQAILDEPPQVVAEGRRLGLRTAELARALQLRPRGGEIGVSLDPKRLPPRLAQAFRPLAKPARDARFVVKGNRVLVAAGTLGRELDLKRLARRLVEEPDARRVEATFAAVRPDLTTREAQAMRIREPVASFTTPFACCAPRVTNIQRGAEILNGTVIPPNGRFSLNEALGERTTERGFVSAPMIEAGRLVDAVGGGVSQIATTIYNAAFFAGLDLVEHTPHQFYISRYPVGREATVSWGGPELIVRNDWPAGILMQVSASDSAITVRLFSSKLGRRVETSTGEPYGHRPATTITVTNSSLPAGSRVVEQDGGIQGFSVEYTRKVWAGAKLKRDERFKWRYDPEDTIIEVGPPKPKPKPAAPQPATPKPGEPKPGEPKPPETPPAEPPAGDPPPTGTGTP